MPRTVTAALAIALLTAIAPRPSLADLIFGTYGRQMGMGGAGLALIDRPDSTQYTNPAAIAFSRRKLGFSIPSNAYRYDGMDLSDARDRRGNVLNAAAGDVTDLALTFSKQPALLDVNAVGGVSAGHLNAGYEIQGRARVTPDAALQAWANSGAATPATGSASVMSGTVTSWPTFSYGRLVARNSSGRLAVGGRLRFQKFHGRSDIVNFDGTEAAPSLSGSGDRNEKGVAFDLGVVMQSRRQPGMSYALVVNNLVHPSFPLVEQKPLVSIGAARTLRGRLALAADAVNLTNAYGDGVDLRAGVELQIASYFAARTGISGRNGLTFGLQLGGVNVAIASGSPFAVSQTLRF